jgi:hypothetical protein
VAAFFVLVFVVVMSVPNCSPNCRFEHDVVNLALTPATHWQVTAATQILCFLAQKFVFLAQVSTSREVVQYAQHERLTPVQLQDLDPDRHELAWTEKTALFVSE